MRSICLVFGYTILAVSYGFCYAEYEKSEEAVEVEYGKLFVLQLTSYCNKILQKVCHIHLFLLLENFKWLFIMNKYLSNRFKITRPL